MNGHGCLLARIVVVVPGVIRVVVILIGWIDRSRPLVVSISVSKSEDVSLFGRLCGGRSENAIDRWME